MIVDKNGFLYDKETKIVIVEFFNGDDIYKSPVCEFFYGTKTDAIEFGLIFKEE